METKTLTCTKCSFFAYSQQELKHHQLTHGFYKASPTASCPQPRQRWQVKQFRCDLCPFVARGKQELQVHEREQHLQEGSYIIQCAHCSYSTNKISSWHQHKLVHPGAVGSTGSCIYMCKMCGWKTKYHHSLVMHVALHTGIKSFWCNHCGFTCARKENLKQHKLTHLKKGIDGKGLLLKCGWCKYTTASSNTLRRHAVTLHNADGNYIPEYQCDTCDFRTTKLSNFSNHKITHLHGRMMVQVNQTGPLKCSLCPFVSEHWDCLQEHQHTHKELRCVQEILGDSSDDDANASASNPQPQPVEAGDQQYGAGEPHCPHHTIIDITGECKNGERGPAPKVEVKAPGTPRFVYWARFGRKGPWQQLSLRAPPVGRKDPSCVPVTASAAPTVASVASARRGSGGTCQYHPPHSSQGGTGGRAGLRSPQTEPPAGQLSNPTTSSRVLEPQQVMSQESQTCPMPDSWLEREQLALKKEQLALKQEKWEVGVFVLQEHKLHLQVELLQQQLRLAKKQRPT